LVFKLLTTKVKVSKKKTIQTYNAHCKFNCPSKEPFSYLPRIGVLTAWLYWHYLFPVFSPPQRMHGGCLRSFFHSAWTQDFCHSVWLIFVHVWVPAGSVFWPPSWGKRHKLFIYLIWIQLLCCGFFIHFWPLVLNQ